HQPPHVSDLFPYTTLFRSEGRRIAAWHKNVIVKVPLTPEGLAAGKILAGEGTRINVTLCFSVNQALLAAAIGAYIETFWREGDRSEEHTSELQSRSDLVCR